jgi:replicative DNA helicase
MQLHLHLALCFRFLLNLTVPEYVIVFIYRADQTQEEEWESSPQNIGIPYPKNIAQIIISKHRNGPVGEFPLYFRDDVIKFESITRPIQQTSMD